MAFSSKILLLVGISLAQFYIVQGQNYMNWVGRCCTKGRRKASKNYDPSSCNSDDLDRRRFQTKFERWICRYAERICCMKEIQKKSCQSGIFEALLGHSCGRFMPFVGGDDFRECCDCCSLGVRAKADNDTICAVDRFPVMLLSDSSKQCTNSFKQCCKGTISPPTVHPTPRKPKCSDNFCQQECQDSPTQGAQCSCRDGYRLKPDKVSCQDINECQLRGGNTCSPLERCVNTPGSYRCENGTTEAACKLGEQLVDGRCIDIDECVRGLHRCGREQTCVNNDGSYSCACRNGFQASGSTCLDKDECSTGEARCPQKSSCVNSVGSYQCQCEQGRQLLNNKCEDVDECSSGRYSCRQGTKCENTDGSYKCVRIITVCRPDQVLGGDGTCKPKRSSVCDRIQCANGFVCNPSVPRRPCEDIDECLLSPPKCKPDETCENYIGTYRCRRDPCIGVDCGEGRKCQPSGRSYSCADIDECATLPRKCTGDQEVCENYYGGYRCKCRDRFQKNDQSGKCERMNSCSSVRCPSGYKCVVIDESSYSCRDIDECRESSPVCLPGQRCVNYPGTHYCSCRNGYRLNSSAKRCEDIDECAERRSGCRQICQNTPGSFVCSCRNGFRMASDRRSCRDVNECLNSPCSSKATCRNTFGSFVCQCKQGYELLPDGLTCRDRNECDSVTCPHRCVNTGGGYYCICPSGYSNQSRYYCSDKDECKSGIAKCKDNEFCFNTYGFYQCIPKLSCSSDYVKVNDKRCERSCNSGDRACLNQKVQKRDLWTHRMRNNETSSTIFNYRIYTYGYKARPMVKFYFRRGNELGLFEIQTQEQRDGASATIRNKGGIIGRRRFILEFHGDVIDSESGDLVSRFEYLMYIFVSRYDY